MMKSFPSIVILSGILQGAYSTTVEPFESQEIQTSWELVGRSNPVSIIALQIALSGPNDEAFTKLAYDIATPFSPYYRRHLSAQELADWVKPSDKSVDHVQKWLNRHNVQGTLSHDLLEIEVSIAKAETLLNTTYFLFRHRGSGSYVDRVKQYYIPNALKDTIEFVTPTVAFPLGNNKNERLDKIFKYQSPSRSTEFHSAEPFHHVGSSKPFKQPPKDLKFHCDYYADPKCIRQLYNVTYTPQPDTNASTAIFLFRSGGPNLTDGYIYLQNFNAPAAKAKAAPELITLFHGNKYPHTGEEENLDSQMVLGLSWPAKSSYAFTGATRFVWGPPRRKIGPPQKRITTQEDVYLKYWHSLTHNETVPSSTTCSDLWNEHSLTPRYMKFLCNKVFARAGARGISVLFPSGDYGTLIVDTSQRPKTTIVQFPATCPWVTVAGATVLIDGVEKSQTYNASVGHLVEYAYASGGGLSNVFSRPKYQKAAVNAYIHDNNIIKKFGDVRKFNPNGRGYPDIAAIGNRLPFVYNAKILNAAGTSASSPIAASIITILNAYEESKGRPPLGFLNPWLYGHPEILNDITVGGPNFYFYCANKTADSCRKFPPGYPTTVGWDAVTGLGSLNLGKMMADLDSMAEAGALGIK